MTQATDPYQSVVVIDDEPAILLAVDTTLRMSGLKRVVTCSDSRQALAILDRHSTGVILLDLNMPHIDGHTLMPMIIERYPDVPIIIITGAIDVGKELAARAIHRLSGRTGDFVAINVAGLDDNIFSDTLFGHVKGAFTGADSHRSGSIEKASGGTLFLDEIGDLNQGAQVKLLRLLQENEYMPLGKDSSQKSDARVIASTHADLWVMQEQKLFRKDLHYRLRTHRVWIPPLRERNEDLPLLCAHFLRQASEALGKPVPELSPDLLPLLGIYPFPGNVRELKAMLFDALAQHQGGMLPAETLKGHMSRAQAAAPVPTTIPQTDGQAIAFGETLPTLKEAGWKLVDEAMRRCGSNQSQAAALLGISQQALSKRLKNMQQ